MGVRLTDVTKPPYRPTLPDEYNRKGSVYWGLFKVCVSELGEVSSVAVVRSTGEFAIDERWTRTIKTWRYETHCVDNRPSQFCTPLRFQITADE